MTPANLGATTLVEDFNYALGQRLRAARRHHGWSLGDVETQTEGEFKASVVGAYYYIRIVKVMWFDESEAGFVPVAGELRLVMGISGLFVLGYVVVGGPLGRAADAAANALFVVG